MHDDVAKRTDPALWDRATARVMPGAHGGRTGQRSARKAQFAVAGYRKAGIGRAGPAPPRNRLARWMRKAWVTSSSRDSAETRERSLPEATPDALGAADDARGSGATQRAEAMAGQQSGRQPAAIARGTSVARRAEASRLARAGKAG